MIDRKKDFQRRYNFGNFESNLRFINQTGIFTKKKRILEIGSGKGHLLHYFYKKGYDIRGIEIDNSYIKESKKMYGQLPLSLVSSSKNLPFDEKFFEVVISFDVFEHIPDTDRHLEEINRILKDKGFYLLSTPNKWANIVFETIRRKSFTKWREEHCSLHSYTELRKRFKQNGFELEFYNIPIVNEYFKKKLETFLGVFGLWLLKVLNPDCLPLRYKTNFFVKAKKLV